MMFCPKCGQPLSPDSQFCAACGAPRPRGSAPEAPAGAGHDATLTTRLPQPPPPPVEAQRDSPWSTGAPSVQPGAGFPSGAPPAAWPPPAYSAPPGYSTAPASPATGRSRGPLLIVGGVLVVLVLIALGVMLPKLLDGGSGAGQASTLDGGFVFEVRSGPASEPKRSWKIDAPSVDGTAIGDGRLFSLESDDGSSALVARSLSDGKEEWKKDLPGSGTVGISGDHLLVSVSDDDGENDELRSYETDSGELRWKTEIADADSNINHVGDRLISVMDGEVVAYDIDDGKEAWSEKITNFLYAVDGDRVYIASGSDVKSVALGDGEEKWKADLDADATAIVAADGRAVVVVGSEAVGLSGGDGKEEWKTDLDTGDIYSAASPSGSKVVLIGSEDATALDAKNGDELDKDDFRVDADEWQGFGLRLPDGEIILAQDEGSKMRSIDPDTGESNGSLDMGDKSFAGIARSFIYVTDEQSVTAHRVEDLKEQWSIDVDNVSEVIAGDGSIVLVTDDGYELWT